MKIELNTWEEVRRWCDEHGTFKPTYVEQINSQLFPKEAFSLGQLSSKFWLLEHLKAVPPPPPNATVAYLGCWIGSLAPFMIDSLSIERIYGFDSDPIAITQSEVFNRRYVEDGWKFKGVIADVSLLEMNNLEFETGGELIQTKPDWVLNTSCEHMDTEWFNTVDSDQLIIMQTNNSPNFPGHINTCDSVEDMQSKYPLSKTLFAGEMVTPVYTRYMQIGYK